MQTRAGTIDVKDYVEHEDGSATLVVDTDPDATRLLVEIGLRRLLEMAVDKENDEYQLENLDDGNCTELIEETGSDKGQRPV